MSPGYDQTDSNTPTTVLEPRGLAALEDTCFSSLWILSFSIGRSNGTVFAVSPPASSPSIC